VEIKGRWEDQQKFHIHRFSRSALLVTDSYWFRATTFEKLFFASPSASRFL
jgi:hypothetical protein